MVDAFSPRPPETEAGRSLSLSLDCSIEWILGQGYTEKHCLKKKKKQKQKQAIMHPPLIPALRRQRQANLCDFETSLAYRKSSKAARATESPEKQNKTNKQKL